jgi:hypothetical protein
MRVYKGTIYPAARTSIDQIRKSLLAVEWVTDGRDDNPYCPACRCYRWGGHDAGCVVAQGLGRLPFVPGIVRVCEDKDGTVLGEVIVTDDLEALARNACLMEGLDPDGADEDRTCRPDSPAFDEDRMPAWWAKLYKMVEQGLVGHSVVKDADRTISSVTLLPIGAPR